MQGWIKLHRGVRSNWLFEEKRTFSKFEAWIDLLLEVNHKDNKVLLGNELIEIKRGQTITSIRQLCTRWGWSNTKVKQFFELLQKDGMITVKSDTKKTVITIDKYEFYQCMEDEKTTQNTHDNDAEQTQKHTNKNEKNEKNEKNIKDYTSEIKELLSRYPKDFIELNKAYWNAMKETRSSKKIQQSVITRTMEKWSHHPIKVVEYALKRHLELNSSDKDEKYTLGIMRKTTNEEAIDKLDRMHPKERSFKGEDNQYSNLF